MNDEEELTGQELYERARQAEINLAQRQLKSRNMKYSGNTHLDYAKEHLD